MISVPETEPLWAANLITSFKVESESKYTEPPVRVSAKREVGAMNNEMRKNRAIIERCTLRKGLLSEF